MEHFYPQSSSRKFILSSTAFKTAIAFFISLFLFAKESNATHFRYGNISWTWVSGKTVTFHVSQSWRRSFYVPAPNVGGTENTSTLSFGDGQTSPVVITITAVNTTDDWFFGEATITHTYATAGPYTAFVAECCRLNTLQNNGNQNDRVSTVVNMINGNSSPVSTLVPIVNLPTGLAAASFLVPAFGPDGEGITYRLSTPAEMGGSTLTQPPGMSINSSTGLVTWKTSGHAVGQLWNASITITDIYGSTTTLDFIIKIVNQSNPPYFDYSITPANGYTYVVPPGQNITFTVKAKDDLLTDNVTLQALGLPVGATMVHSLPVSGNPVQSTFSWTPTTSQVGARVINFLGQDQNGVQITTAVNIIVSYNPVFDSPPTPPDSSSSCMSSGTTVTDTVEFHSPDAGMKLSIISASVPAGATLTPAIPTPSGNKTSTVFNWTPQVSDWGLHNMTFSAKDTLGRISTAVFQIVVNTQPAFRSLPPANLTISQNQPFVYNITVKDTDMTYGDIVDIIGVTLPSWLTLEESAENGTAILTGIPGAANIGINAVQLQAADSFDHCYGPVNQFFNINVVPCSFTAQIAPVISGPFCPGQAVQLMATAGSSYTWSTGDTSQIITITAGSSYQYSVTVISGFCAATASYTVTGEDHIPPVAVCKNITVSLVNGAAAITAANIDGGSHDNCGIASLAISKSSFDCSNIGANNVALTATDFAGNSSSCMAVVMVIDNQPPTSVCKNITLPLINGSAHISASDVDGGSTDNCRIVSRTLSQSDFTCSDVGDRNVTLTVTDVAGNSASCTAVVTVVNNIPPVAMCKNVTVALIHGTASITASDVDGGSTSACAITTSSVSPSSFSCSNLGSNHVTLTVTDASGNSSSCTALVTVVDNTPPVAICRNVTKSLGSTGTAIISPADVDGGSFDDCRIASMTVSKSIFTVADLGSNNVQLTVTDIAGNSSFCNAIVTITDTTIPKVFARNLRLALNNGEVTVTPDQVDGGSYDGDGIGARLLSPASFNCSNLGPNTVAYTVYDSAGNSTTVNLIITVVDTIPPVAVCKNITVPLTGNSVSISASDIDGGSTDNCSIESLSVSPSSFNCSNLGVNDVVLTVTDSSGNSSTCYAVVTVIDTTPPIAICRNITIALVNGMASIAVGDVDGGSSDNCGIASKSLSNYSFGCSDLGLNSVTLTVTDGSGNSSSCIATVTVIDTVPPVAVCKNITVPLTGNSVSISAGDVDGGSTDNCSISSSYVTPSLFDCSNIGPNPVILTVTDIAGNSASCQAIVTIIDNMPPVVVCKNITVALTNGSAAISVSDIDGGSFDNCGIASSSLSAYSFDCSDLGPNKVTFTVTDGSGNSSSCPAIVTIIDTTAPVAVCKNITIPLIGNSATISASDVDGGSTGNCSIATLSVSPSSFDCSNLGANDVLLTVTDSAGNSSSCHAIVTVVDTIPPVTICTNITVGLVNGMAAISPSDIDGGSFDNCGIATELLSTSTFNCSNLGPNNVTLTVTDASGNSSSCTAIVTVVDNTAPTSVCKNITVALVNGSASVSPSDIDGGSSDDCGIASMSLSQSTFDCSNLGANNIMLTVTDASGNSSYCVATVTVIDNTAPVAICKNITIGLIGGSATIGAADVDGGSTDDCGIATSSVTPSSFDCSKLGANPVTLTVTDASGNSSSCKAVVTIIDNTPPSAVCKNITVELNGGSASISAADVDGGSNDDCGIASASVSPSTFDCSNLGANTVVLTVTDPAGNSSSCGAIVMVLDNTPPVAVCKNITVELTGGSATIGAGDLDGGSTDNCGIVSRSISQSTFDCTNLGTNNVTLTVSDASGNASSCNAMVTVVDNTPPVAVCRNISIALNGNSASISAGDVDGGSTDNCGIASRSVAPSSFSCSSLGANTVTLTVTDASGNSSSCTAIVTVIDNTPPVVACKNITVELHGISAGITASDIDAGSTDNCGITSSSVSPSSFDCSNLGTNDITLTVMDASGNSSSCHATVTVVDNTPPVAVCKNITVALTGNVARITSADVDGGSTDNCAIVSRTISKSSFTCSDMGANNVTLTVMDAAGNAASCNAIVTVIDNTPPVAVCKNITVALQGSTAAISAADIDGGSTDNCGIASHSVSPSVFDCSKLGANQVTLTITDASGNSSSCNAIVTVVDNTPPVAVCKNLTITLAGGSVSITAADIDGGSNDNCSIVSETISKSQFNCSNVGINHVQLTVTDESGNSASCDALVTVIDNTLPTAVCKDINLVLPAASASISAADIDGGSTDNCGIALRTASKSLFTCSDIGANTVVLTVMDPSGNSASCNAIVTVVDTTAPVAVCKNTTVQLIGTSAIIGVPALDGGSHDNCSIVFRSISQSTFNCSNLGANNVTLTVMDGSGNSSSCTAVVTVQDNTPPVVICKNITIPLVGNSASITAASIDNGSTDNCGIASRTISKSSFNCSNLGPNNVTLTVTDASGNSSSCIAVVTVIDNTPPVAICRSITLTLNSPTVSITADSINNGSSDNCGIASMSISQSVFGASNIGSNNVTLTVTDASGNSSSCNAIVTVKSNTPANILCKNYTVVLNGSSATITAANLDGGSTAPAGIASRSISKSSFDCSNIGANNVTFSVLDSAGFTYTCNAIVTVIDNTPPVAVCKNITVPLSGSSVTITAAQVDGGSTDNCGIASRTVSPATFTCANLGANTVTLTVTDPAGNTSSCTAIVTVVDITPPVVTCKNITLLMEHRTLTITPDQVDNGSTDNCTIVSRTVTPSTFTCADLGTNNVTLTVTDEAGNSSSCTAVVTLEDHTLPLAIGKNITVYLDHTGSVSVTGMDVDGGSTPYCGIGYRNVSPSTFNCSNIGANAVTLTVSDFLGNTSSTTAVVTVLDSTAPAAVCKNITIPLVGASANITPANIDGGSTDNCGITSRSISTSFFTCANLGPNNVTLTVYDGSNNASSCTAVVTVIDNTPPTVICKNITIPLTGNTATITAANIDNGSFDNCSIASRAISKTTFNCSNLGPNNVTLTVTDGSGNTASCVAVVTVIDNTPPVAICKSITVPLTGGTATITAAMIDNGSTDNCGIASRSLSQSSFSCANVGPNSVTLTVTDASGNASSCTAIVTVVDNTAPVAVCKNITLSLIGNSVSITGSNIDGGSTDNCGIVSKTASPSTFNCSNLGANNVTLTVTDAAGNASSCTAVVTVVDNTPPVVICKNITVPLVGGAASITAAMIDNGSTDNCSIASRTITPSSFTCANLGANSVTLKVTDASGNSSSCTATVTVIDNTPPVAVCKNITVALVGNTATITAASVDGGSTDNCGIASRTVSPSSFTCANLGANSVTLTVKDASGNSSSCTATVTVIDNTPPVAVCKNITVPLIGGSATITGTSVDGGSTDNCSVAARSVSPSSFTCANIGPNNVTLTVKDASGNTSTCTAVVTVIDNTPPTAVCKTASVSLSGGQVNITASQVDGGSSDNCSIATRTVTPNHFTCANIGANTVTLTVTDASGNSSSCTTTVTVVGTPLTATLHAIPNDTTYTGGNPNDIYLGYGAQNTNLGVTATGGAPFTYTWSSGSGLSCTNCASPLYTPTAAGNFSYNVSVTNTYGCTVSQSITISVTDIRDPKDNKKVLLCHVPPGNPGNPQTLSLAPSAVATHLRNHAGDHLGSCSGNSNGNNDDGDNDGGDDGGDGHGDGGDGGHGDGGGDGHGDGGGDGHSDKRFTTGDSTTNAIAKGDLEILLYPNPFRNQFHVRVERGSTENIDVKILDVSGKLVQEIKGLSPTSDILLGSNTANGVYMAEITQGNSKKTFRIVKTE